MKDVGENPQMSQMTQISVGTETPSLRYLRNLRMSPNPKPSGDPNVKPRTRRFVEFLPMAFALTAIALGVWCLIQSLSPGAAHGQCVGGVCGAGSSSGPQDAGCAIPPRGHSARDPAPQPAWRYVEPAGPYRAVVRVRGERSLNRPQYGSGVAVRWSRRVVVLSAGHVVQGCRRVWVWLATPKRWATADAARIDSDWDVAVLTVSDADAAQLEPAQIAWGDDATPAKGARLETCGFGPDGRLAANSGVLLGYRSNGGGRWADWIDVSGTAREGDSGGPVFDAKGQVVGILWGTDRRTVTATQAGYLHILLAGALGRWDGSEAVLAADVPRSPETDAVAASASADRGACDCAASETCVGKLLPRLGKQKTPEPAPTPQVIVKTDPEVRDSLGRMEGTLAQVAQNTAPRPEPTAPEAVPGWAKVLLIVAAIAAGAIVFYGVQRN